MKILEEQMKKICESALRNWGHITGFIPVEQLVSIDESGGYEVSSMHVFKLLNGYAIVYESGCSCYDPSEADVSLYPNLEGVKEALYMVGRRSEYTRLSRLCLEKL